MHIQQMLAVDKSPTGTVTLAAVSKQHTPGICRSLPVCGRHNICMGGQKVLLPCHHPLWGDHQLVVRIVDLGSTAQHTRLSRCSCLQQHAACLVPGGVQFEQLLQMQRGSCRSKEELLQQRLHWYSGRLHLWVAAPHGMQSRFRAQRLHTTLRTVSAQHLHAPTEPHPALLIQPCWAWECSSEYLLQGAVWTATAAWPLCMQRLGPSGAWVLLLGIPEYRSALLNSPQVTYLGVWGGKKATRTAKKKGENRPKMTKNGRNQPKLALGGSADRVTICKGVGYQLGTMGDWY